MGAVYPGKKEGMSWEGAQQPGTLLCPQALSSTLTPNSESLPWLLLPGTLTHFQSLTPTWMHQWSPLRRLHCISASQPAPAWDSSCLTLPLTPLTHSHMCLFPWHPGVLARNSTPISSTPRHSLSPSLLSAWPCLDLTHPLVAC